MVGAFAALGVEVRCFEQRFRHQSRRVLTARFDQEWESASWALVGGGVSRSMGYVCCEVRNADLPLDVDPVALLRERVDALPASSAGDRWVATMTSADVAAHAKGEVCVGGVTACVLATAGFANALRVGEVYDGPPRTYLPGTINLACWINCPLTLEAQLEALSIAAQARTLEVLEAKLASLEGGAFASGTGTDCIALFSPVPRAGGVREPYAGMHTASGRVIGQSVRHAMRLVIANWRKRVRA